MKRTRIRLTSVIALVASFLVSISLLGGSYPIGSATQLFEQPQGTIDLSDGSRIGSNDNSIDGSPLAAIYGGMLRLADRKTPARVGSFKLPDLDPGNVVMSFDLRFTVTMNSPTGSVGGEGWSVNFGRIPEDHGTGEGGFVPLPRGLTVAFDTLEDEDDPPSIEIFVGGVSVANFPRQFALDGVSRSVSIHWDAFGLDLNFDNKVICTDLATPGFSPGVGNVFAFSARTTGSVMDVFLDNLRATTEALPVINTGGPIISEFVTDNSEFEDEFGGKPDWLELFNGSAETVDLTGWFLTDSKKTLTKWRIEGGTLTPYNYMVVFASGRSRQLSTTSFLHAGFSLARRGGYLALVRPNGTVASQYEYGPQEKNISFGEKGAARVKGFMYPASPGLMNTQDPAPFSLSPEVQFSHQGGFVSSPVTVALSVSNSPSTQIRYTLDRTEPGLNSPLYSTPLLVTKFTVIRARSYTTNHIPGRVTSRGFIWMDATLTNYAETGKIFDSNLPLVFIDSYGVNVDGSTGGTRPFRSTFTMVIAPDKITGRSSLTNAPDYAGPAGVHVRGESSAGFDQRSYTLELWDESDRDNSIPLLGMPADSDWVLYGPWSEKTLMRNKLIFDWMRTLRGEDGTAVRTRFVELFFNQTKSTNAAGNFASYRGIYVLMEKLKRGKDRVPLENLNQKTVDPELITGGYIIRHDKPDSLKNNWTSSGPFGVTLQSYDPDRFNGPQLTYVRNYINSFQTALNGVNFRDFEKGYQAYIDPDTFIDAQWMLEISKQVDGYVFSTYWHKDRGRRLRAGPLWDFNIALGNADYGTGDTPTGWLYGVANGVGQLWYPKLHSDPNYKLAHWDRYWTMRQSLFSTEEVMRKIDENMRILLDGYSGLISNRAPASIQNPAARHFRRWPRLGMRDWPNPPAETSIRSYQAEVGYMTNWLKNRLNWIDDQSLRVGRLAYRPPVFSHEGGSISGPVILTIEPYRRIDPAATFAEGEIYYTLDNSDPRLAGGAINPSARKYAGPIEISRAITVKARLFDQKLWTPLAAATFLLEAVPASASNLVISEIMFRPGMMNASETNAALVDPQGFEFLELRNRSKSPIDLSGVKFTRGPNFDFAFEPRSSRLLASGESVVLVADKRAFMVRYPSVPLSKIVGQFRGHLDNGGETLSLVAANGSVIQEFRYDDDPPWPNIGTSGKSLILKDSLALVSPGEATSWVASAKAGGTPGESGLGADTFSGDPSKDTDGDGISDLYEFATGSDLENPNSGYLPEARIAPMSVDGRTGNYLVVEYSVRAGLQGVSVTLDQSSDLRNWVPGNGGWVELTTSTSSTGRIPMRLRSSQPVQAGNHATFYRVRVKAQ